MALPGSFARPKTAPTATATAGGNAVARRAGGLGQPGAYAAGRGSPQTQGWRRPNTSADAIIRPNLQLLRDGARQLVRDHPHATRLAQIARLFVGDRTVRPVAATNDDAERRAAAEVWDRFVETCDPDGQMDFYAQQSLLAETVAVAGEALAVWSFRTNTGWQRRIFEPDHLDTGKNEVGRNGQRIVLGVEYDSQDRRVAFWIFPHHPGDMYHMGAARFESQRVPARYVDHVYDVRRPGQTRGVTWFAPAMLKLRDVGQLSASELIRRKLESCISMVVTSGSEETSVPVPLTENNGQPTDGGHQLVDGSGNPYEQLVPGMILHTTQPGSQVEFMTPTASPGLNEHVSAELRAVAASWGVPAHELDMDPSKANFSSLRMGNLSFTRWMRRFQEEMMVGLSGRPAWTRVMQAAEVAGEVDRAPRATWRFTVLPPVDELKHNQADRIAVEMGWKSPQQVIVENGGDPDQVLRERAEWAANGGPLPAGSLGDLPVPDQNSEED